MKYYIGIDIEYNNILGIVINAEGKVFDDARVAIERGDTESDLTTKIVEIVNRFIFNLTGFKNDFIGIGIGCTGLVDSERGSVVYSNSLTVKYYDLAQKVSESIGLPVKVTNNANAAVLGETKFGAGKKYKNVLFVKISDGIGGGCVIDGKLFEGYKSAGMEIGHTVIVENGEPCSCGRRGCFEAYASLKALKSNAEAAILNTKTKMCRVKNITAATPFEYMECDSVAKSIVDDYCNHLACGITNLVNIFRSQVVILGGEIVEFCDKLLNPLKEYINKQIFGGNSYAPVKVVKAALGNQSVLFGAVALFK